MQTRITLFTGLFELALALSFAGEVSAQPAQPAQERRGPAQQQTRRSQRVKLPEVQVVSPDEQVKFTLLPNAERLTYTVTLGDTTVIEPSPLVMNLDRFDLSSGVVFSNVERNEISETYPWFGNHAVATNHCKCVRINLEHDLSLTPYTVEVRVFDDGVAYRQVIPGEEHLVRTPDEYSAFIIPAGSVVWYAGLAAGHYEDTYERKDSAEVKLGEWSGPPLTFKLPDSAGYASITEANLVNYSGMALESDGRRGWIVALGHRQPLNYPFELRYGREEGKRLGKPAAITGSITTPWRVVMVGRDLSALVNSTILPNLCPPPDSQLFPQGIKTPWIKPGRAVWRYVDSGPQGVEGMKEFSRWAGELGFEHHVIEGFWSRWTMEERKDVVDFSKQRGVGVWLWKHSRDLRTEAERQAFFKMLEQLGVTGAKIDFFDHEHKELVDLYETLLREAAQHHLSLIFHGANKPTGRARTWPNEVVREAIKGMESSRLTERARHQVILPFTRYLAGPADYTTMIFSQRRGDTTLANQIASDVILNSLFQTIAANPQSILTNAAANLIKSIPSVWDETVVLPESEIGELAAFARRSGETWFLAVMNGAQRKTLNLSLEFLRDGDYRAVLVRDAEGNPAGIQTEHATARRAESLKMELVAGGGFVATFSKQ